jgi:serine/threonine-protein kinase
LAWLAALGAASALWSLFLWAELLLSRSGGGGFCGPGGALDCSAAWDGAFAAAVHRLTGLPVAGWGLAWGLVAFVLPLAALVRVAEGRPATHLVSAIRLAAAGGTLAVAALVAALVAARAVCLLCAVTYVLVGLYAGIALVGWRSAGFPQARRAAATAVVGVAAAFLLLLYPGTRTPRSRGEAGRLAIAAAAQPVDEAPPVGTADPRRDQALEQLIASMDSGAQQTLSDSLAIYRSSPKRNLPPPRALVGSDLAPVRITEFTDILCEHCASLYETLDTLRQHTPPGSFAVDARQYPLDGRCNPLFREGTGDDVRCVAARARICVEPTGREPDFARALFANQEGLTTRKVIELATPFMAREPLSACLDSSATRARLEQDIAAATQFESDGTPVVVVNGRRGTSFGPFLYAMVLTRGGAAHPVFDRLPRGNPAAHLH